MNSKNHRRAERKPEALARQAEWASLSTAEQIKALDTRLGKGVGAAKQRARLAGAKKAPVEAPVAAKAEGEAAEAAPKKLKAKERRAKAVEA